MNVLRFSPGTSSGVGASVGGDVLGGDDRALDDEQVDALGEHVRGELGGVLRRKPDGDAHPGLAQLARPGAAAAPAAPGAA